MNFVMNKKDNMSCRCKFLIKTWSKFMFILCGFQGHTESRRNPSTASRAAFLFPKTQQYQPHSSEQFINAMRVPQVQL
jgi:hypothetical protein